MNCRLQSSISHDTVGTLGQTTYDAALLLEVIAGADAEDPSSTSSVIVRAEDSSIFSQPVFTVYSIRLAALRDVPEQANRRSSSSASRRIGGDPKGYILRCGQNERSWRHYRRSCRSPTERFGPERTGRYAQLSFLNGVPALYGSVPQNFGGLQNQDDKGARSIQRGVFCPQARLTTQRNSRETGRPCFQDRIRVRSRGSCVWIGRVSRYYRQTGGSSGRSGSVGSI